MLQAIRLNVKNAQFYVEYFKFELAFLTRITQRRNILRDAPSQKEESKIKPEGEDFLKFDSDDEGYGQKEKALEEAAMKEQEGGLQKILEIVFDTISTSFSNDLEVFA